MKLPSALVGTSISFTAFRQPVGFDAGEIVSERLVPQAQQVDPAEFARDLLGNFLVNEFWTYGQHPSIKYVQNGNLIILVWNIQNQREGFYRSVHVHIHVKGNKYFLGSVIGHSHGVSFEIKPTDQGNSQAVMKKLRKLLSWCAAFIEQSAQGAGDGKDSKDSKDNSDSKDKGSSNSHSAAAS